jgi:CheY-like chemotaxis protein
MARRSQRVLLISHHEGVRDLLQWLLRTIGYSVFTAADGASGMDELLVADEPLVVVLELDLPRMSGGELLRRVASAPERLARHRFIALSEAASALTPEEAQIVHVHRVPVLTNPIPMERFLETVRAADEELSYSENHRTKSGPREA